MPFSEDIFLFPYECIKVVCLGKLRPEVTAREKVGKIFFLLFFVVGPPLTMLAFLVRAVSLAM